MAYGRVAKFEELKSLAFGSITGAYAAVGTATTDYTRIVTFTNTTNQAVYISLDGTTNQLYLPSGVIKVIDISANKVRDDGLFIPKGTVFYTKHTGSAPTSGAVYIEVLYAGGGY